MQNRVKSGTTLGSAIDRIIKEQIKSSLYQNSLDEKERQRQFLGEEDDESEDLFGDDEDSDDEGDAEKDSKASKTVGAEMEKIKTGNITPDDIISKLNGIRAGHSLKDDTIASKLEEYVESLTRAEKVALMAFLKGISQIVSGEVDAENAIDPSEDPAHVKMRKGEKVQKKTIKPNVIKAPAKDEKKKKPSSEDTTGPVPITPKK